MRLRATLQPDATPLGWRQSDTLNLNNDSPILRASRLQLSRSRQFPRGGFVLPQVPSNPTPGSRMLPTASRSLIPQRTTTALSVGFLGERGVVGERSRAQTTDL